VIGIQYAGQNILKTIQLEEVRRRGVEKLLITDLSKSFFFVDRTLSRSATCYTPLNLQYDGNAKFPHSVHYRTMKNRELFMQAGPQSLCFLLNNKNGRATIAAKHEKDRKGNKEDVVWLKRTRIHVSSEKFKKIYEVLKGLSYPRWRHGFLKPLAIYASLVFFVSLALSAPYTSFESIK
jgi:hypothetical protein